VTVRVQRLIAATSLVLAGSIAVADAQRALQTRTDMAAAIERARAAGVDHFRLRAAERGASIAEDFTVTQVHVDRLSMVHTRVQQRFRGIPVFGGEAMAHVGADGRLKGETNRFLANVAADAAQRLTPRAAIAIAVAAYGCTACLTAAPTARLWIVRHDGVDRLAYVVRLRRIDGTIETALPVVFVDAGSGEVIWQYDDFQRGTGQSLYSGIVAIDTTRYSAGSALESAARRYGTFAENGPYALPPPYHVLGFTFDDLFDDNDLWDAPDQRAAVDAHYAAGRYLSYLQSVHDRNGVDGSGGPGAVSPFGGGPALLSQFVHYGNNVNNAGWLALADPSTGDPAGGVAVYGDGDGVAYSPLVSLDTVAHELTHGLIQYTANLVYFGESGAINESWADVFGALTKRHVQGETASTWRVLDDAYTPAVAGDALRYLDTPHHASEKGYTADDDPDHYSERYLGNADNGGVHINSGIANKAFHLVAKGGRHHLGGSMAGVGADVAGRIWFTALRSYMLSSTDFAGARAATVNAAAALYGPGSVPHAAVSTAWCMVGVGVCTTPTADAVTPSAGTGLAQTFEFAYWNPQGAPDLDTAWVWFRSAAAASAVDSCLAYYRLSDRTAFLLDDAARAWQSGAVGAGATLSNSQCAISLGGSSASLSGSRLTLRLAVTFKPGWAGARSIFMFAGNAAAQSGWQHRGDWTVPSAPLLSAVSATPSSGTSPAQEFVLRYSDSAGALDLAATWVWFKSIGTNGAANSCLLYYERASSSVFLLNDSGSSWSSARIGANASLQNTQCAVAVHRGSAVASGDVLTLTLGLTFAPAFAGSKRIMMYAVNASGINSGWHDRGTWTVPAEGAVVSAISATPSTGAGAARVFSLRYGDSRGATDLSTAWVWFRARPASGAAGSCLVYHSRAAATFFLLNDAGTAWLSGSAGSSTALANGQCTVTLDTAVATTTGPELLLTVPITFEPRYSGTKDILMFAANATGASSGWVDRGDWTVPGTGITADSVSPSSGTGMGATFALEYTAAGRAADLTAWVWFRKVSQETAPDSCLIHYDPSRQVLLLLDDAGSIWEPAAPGSNAVAQNSQCAVTAAGSGAVVDGATLTVTVAVTFTPAYVGPLEVYMFGRDVNGMNSGWQHRGNWTAGAEASRAETVLGEESTPSLR
jgi:Zn-dependent metalloprotease